MVRVDNNGPVNFQSYGSGSFSSGGILQTSNGQRVVKHLGSEARLGKDVTLTTEASKGYSIHPGRFSTQG